MLWSSVPGVVDVTLVRGAAAGAALPSVVVEMPHGATRTADFDALRERLRGPFPDDLVAFFHVNTDAGAPEVGAAFARRWVEARPTESVLLLTSRVPRTFVDCNRALDTSAEALREGKVTPGLPPYVRDADDRALLTELHRAYQDVAERAFAAVCGAGGRALLLHTYAPRSVDVEVDDHIVASLRSAYTADNVGRWPLRPEVDVIGRTLDGRRMVPAEVVDAMRAAFARIGLSVADGETYPMHPATAAYRVVERFPGRVVCVEVRRDVLTDAWAPFEEMRVAPARVEAVGAALADALAATAAVGVG